MEAGVLENKQIGGVGILMKTKSRRGSSIGVKGGPSLGGYCRAKSGSHASVTRFQTRVNEERRKKRWT